MPRGGRTSHIRYDHYNFVSIVHVICPRCQKRAKAIPLLETGELYPYLFFGEFQIRDLKCWKIACEFCPLRLEVPFPKKITTESRKVSISWGPPYAVLGNFYYKIESMEFWAYNIDHLEAIVKYLEGTLKKDNPYHFVVTSYVRSAWKIKKKKLLALIRRKYQIE
jgi:hypothetical protein